MLRESSWKTCSELQEGQDTSRKVFYLSRAAIQKFSILLEWARIHNGSLMQAFRIKISQAKEIKIRHPLI